MVDELSCDCRMPLAWRQMQASADERAAMLHEATLLLTAINQIEGGHESEAGPENRRLERLEAKLDLALHLLARVLAGDSPGSPRATRLWAGGLDWEDVAPPGEGTPLLLELRPSPALPLTLRLPARALAPLAGRGRAHFEALPEALADALVQLVFRRHRKAIRARAG